MIPKLSIIVFYRVATAKDFLAAQFHIIRIDKITHELQDLSRWGEATQPM
jgi:hypothetical protein